MQNPDFREGDDRYLYAEYNQLESWQCWFSDLSVPHRPEFCSVRFWCWAFRLKNAPGYRYLCQEMSDWDECRGSGFHFLKF